MLHVPGHGKQLRRGHRLGGRLDDDLVSGLEGDRLVLAEGQSAQGTVGRVLEMQMDSFFMRRSHDQYCFEQLFFP